jgi:ceramide glucosyltransferase
MRWAQLRRASFGKFYAVEILGNPLVPVAAAAIAAGAAGVPATGAATLVAAIWYGAEMALTASAGWPLPLTYPAQAILRDLLLPVLWVAGWRDRASVWRGNTMTVDDVSRPEAA